MIKTFREQAENNVKHYLDEGLLKKTSNETAKQMFIKNSELSLATADKLFKLETSDYKPWLWVIVAAYYSMYYIANAVLLKTGYKVGTKISHKITSDALIVFITDKLKKGLLNNYLETKDHAQEITASRADYLIKNFELERLKRSRFQYEMSNEIKMQKAKTSLKRAKEFVFEIKKSL